MGTNQKGSREYRSNERAAQERYNVPIAKAGRDSIARRMNTEQYRANHDAIDWRRGDITTGPPGVEGARGCSSEPGPAGPGDEEDVTVQLLQLLSPGTLPPTEHREQRTQGALDRKLDLIANHGELPKETTDNSSQEAKP